VATARSNSSKTASRKPKAHFSIAQAEKEYTSGLDEVEPFTVELKSGEVITFRDPRTLGWQVAASLDITNPYGMFRQLVEDEDYEKLVSEDFVYPILRQIGEAWREHYGVEDLAEGN